MASVSSQQELTTSSTSAREPVLEETQEGTELELSTTQGTQEDSQQEQQRLELTTSQKQELTCSGELTCRASSCFSCCFTCRSILNGSEADFNKWLAEQKAEKEAKRRRMQ